MDRALVVRKIQALLHDPPEKPIILGRVAHEGRAKEIMGRLIEEAKIPDEVREADHIASAADRIDLPKDEKFTSDFLREPVIIHPLSGKEFDLKSLAQIEINQVTAAVDSAISGLAERYGHDEERLYLSLWRQLVEVLINDGKSFAHLGQLWELLPADTRIPDHAIWEHKRVTSAVAGALPDPAFLLFAIGPVQDFIATARKTQDLWSGSYLLSYLSWCAMKVVAGAYGPDSVLFPDLCRQPLADLWLSDKGLDVNKPGREQLSAPTLPNRFFALVPQAGAEEIAHRAEEAVKNAFEQICRSVKDSVAEKLSLLTGTEWDRIWSRQAADFLEVYWAYVTPGDQKTFMKTYRNLFEFESPWEFEDLLKEYEAKGFKPNIGTMYGQIFHAADRTLGSRKTVRDFRPSEEPSHKCTLCGVREPVHPGFYNDQHCSEEFGALQGFWRDVMIPAFPDLRKAERLCSICLTKRLAPEVYFRKAMGLDINDNFPSVSMLATASFKLRVLEHMDHPSVAVAVGNYVDAVKGLVGERWKGIAVPMVRRACRDARSLEFAMLEGDWLYPEAFAEGKSLWEENKTRLTSEAFAELLKNAQRCQKTVFDVLKRIEADKGLTIGSPSRYYAALLMDGDNMGRWLSGETAPHIESVLHPAVRNSLPQDWDLFRRLGRPLSPSLHLTTSKALRDFSLHVAREIVEKDHLGKLVYAGGDDVLAFISLSDLPNVMRKLRAYFSGSLRADTATNKVAIDFKDGAGYVPLDEKGLPINAGSGKPIRGFMLSMGTTATASMGVVIAHHSSNLSQVLREVRHCEKKAKGLKGKNAFRIALMKRAGGTEHLMTQWYFGDECRESVPVLLSWAEAFRKEWMSPKFAYAIRTESSALGGLPDEAIRLELCRIADRQRNKKAEGFTKVDMEKLIDGLMGLSAKDADQGSGISDLEGVCILLSIAAFLGRKENL